MVCVSPSASLGISVGLRRARSRAATLEEVLEERQLCLDFFMGLIKTGLNNLGGFDFISTYFWLH